MRTFGTHGGIIGIGVAVYLVFYTRKSIFYQVISACITGLSGIPSILFGLVGYTLLIYQFGLGRSLLCSAICVAVMIVPFIAIRAEKILKEKGHRIHEEFTGTWNVQRICGHTINSSGLCSGIAWNGGAWNGIRNGSGCTDFVYGCGYGRRCSGKTYGSIYVIAVSSVYAGKLNWIFLLDYAYGTAFVLMLFLLLIQIICKCITYIRKDY